MIVIISVGKRHDPELAMAISRYEKRLRKPFGLEWVLLPHSTKTGPQCAKDESERILKRLGSDDAVVLLDERGKEFSTADLADTLDAYLSQGKRVVLVIGGAYGVTEELRKRASVVWSLSSLTFPHQIVRLLLVEQLYRAQTILRGEPYHHE